MPNDSMPNDSMPNESTSNESTSRESTPNGFAPNGPSRRVSPAAVQRGFRHWTILGIGAVVLIVVFLLRR